MGLPPPDYSDSNAWQSIGPSKTPDGAVGPDGIIQKLPGPEANQSSPESDNDSDDSNKSDGPSRTMTDGRGSVITIPNLEDLTPQTPLAQFASGSKFQNFTLFIIVLNGLWIGIDVEWNHPSMKDSAGRLPLEPTCTAVEHSFCVYFTLEIVIRIIAFGKKNRNDAWFLFDFVLVLFMVIETWIMPIIEAIIGGGGEGILSKFSALRLLRLSRLTRIMTSLPELLTLIKGMINAARAVAVVLALLILLLYVFAIVFTAQIGDPDAPEHVSDYYWVTGEDPTSVQLFGSMIDSMMSLFTRGMLGDNLAETLQAIKDRGGEVTCELDDESGLILCAREPGNELKFLALMWVFLFFMVLSAFCLLNMLVGVLCEVITDTASEEAESAQITELYRNIDASFRAIDASGDNTITKAEWSKMRSADTVRASFILIGVDEAHMESQLDQIEDHLFGGLDKNKMLKGDNWKPDKKVVEEDQGIPMSEFFTRILETRPDAAASYLDLAILQTRAERDEGLFIAQLDHVEDMITRKLRKALPNASPDALPDAPDLSGTEHQWRSSSPVERIQIEEPNNGTSATNDWLQGLPTDVLFAELKHRATLNSTLPAIDVY